MRRPTSDISFRPELAFRRPTAVGIESSQLVFYCTLAVSVSLAIWGAFTVNATLTFACAVIPPVLNFMLLRRAHSPVLLMAVAMHWVQASTPVFYANLQGQSINRLFLNSKMEEATWLSLLGVLALAGGIWVSWIGMRPKESFQIESEARAVDVGNLFIRWIVSFGVASVMNTVAWRSGGLVQLILAIASIKWIFFFIFAYSVMVQRTGFELLLVAVAIEFATGLLGQFAQFKLVFLMLFVIGCCLNLRLTEKGIVAAAMGVVSLIAISAIWSGVKMDYRTFLSDNPKAPAFGANSKLEKLQNLITHRDRSRLSENLDTLTQRVGYTEYFAHTLDYVPRATPHENGELWLGAIKHVVQPRLLFPKKDVTNDSMRTRKYTGIRVAGSEGEGTSIGLGYFAESYVDFGIPGMFVPIFILGSILGFLYRFVVEKSRMPLLGVSVVTAILFNIHQAFEASNIKIFGSFVTHCVVLLPSYFLFEPRLVAWFSRLRR
jgi:hypothetical protein